MPRERSSGLLLRGGADPEVRSSAGWGLRLLPVGGLFHKHRVSTLPPRQTCLWIWGLWLVAFYAVWAILNFGLGWWELTKAHWPISLTMLVGGYVAGSTPMGGGTVGFPILVLFFDQPASLGRDFSFAVQSIGMVSASIFILCRRQPLAWALLKGAVLGSAVGTSLGLLVVAPFLPELVIKVAFAVIWASFGVLHLFRWKEICSQVGMVDFNERWDFRLGLWTGLLAGLCLVSVTGVGIDMAVYAVLVLLCRADLKIAIPTSILIMAFNSVLGSFWKGLLLGFVPGVFGNWLAAAPIVVLGAPLGVLVVSLIGRAPTLLFVSVLCLFQFVWTCWAERQVLGWVGTLWAVMAVGLGLWGFEALRSWGRHLAKDDLRPEQLRNPE